MIASGTIGAFKGILFDFDGVLAQSMEDHAAAWIAAIASFGGTVTFDDYMPLEGSKLTEVANVLWEKSGLPGWCDPAAVSRAKEEYYLRNHHFRFYPGVESFIDILNGKGVAIAIVTASLSSNLQATVPAEFLKKFRAVVTGDQVPRGKPFPDPYLVGAEHLGLLASQCIVVENSPLGVAAAKAAGAYCIGITSTVSAEILKEADLIIPSFEDLSSQEIIKHLL
ncbi:MAG: HAD family phosphatase [bacterium]|nr:HAD family phosphatase [bacterium]